MGMDLKHALAMNVMRYREQRNLSQNGLAKKCPTVSQSTVWRIENQQVDADIGTIGELAQALGVAAWQLLTDERETAVVFTAAEARAFYAIKEIAAKKN